MLLRPSLRRQTNFRWGLIPGFTKAGEKLDHYRMFNARSETVDTKPVFSRLISRQRCAVLLDGFYGERAGAQV